VTSRLTLDSHLRVFFANCIMFRSGSLSPWHPPPPPRLPEVCVLCVHIQSSAICPFQLRLLAFRAYQHAKRAQNITKDTERSAGEKLPANRSSSSPKLSKPLSTSNIDVQTLRILNSTGNTARNESDEAAKSQHYSISADTTGVCNAPSGSPSVVGDMRGGNLPTYIFPGHEFEIGKLHSVGGYKHDNGIFRMSSSFHLKHHTSSFHSTQRKHTVTYILPTCDCPWLTHILNQLYTNIYKHTHTRSLSRSPSCSLSRARALSRSLSDTRRQMTHVTHFWLTVIDTQF